jgi:hypothetical protein
MFKFALNKILMKNVCLAILLIGLLIGCNTKSGITNKDLVGVYSGSIKLDSMPTGNDEASVRTRAMLENIKLTYEFKEDGSGKSTGEMMGMKNTLDLKWAVQGKDSLKVTMDGQPRSEIYAVAKTDKGINLKGPGATLILTKQ